MTAAKYTTFCSDMRLPTILIAYAAGVLSFLAPCGAVLLPSFFAYAFKKRTALVVATWWFFAGFMTLFLPIGLGATALSSALIVHRDVYSVVGGIALFGLAGLALVGKGLHVPLPKFLRGRKQADGPSAYVIGVAFGFTIAGCTAPLLALSLAFATLSGNFLTATLVLLSFGLGLVSPLLAIAAVSDRTRLLQHRFFRGVVWNFRLAGKERTLHSTNVLAATLLVIIGGIFIASQGTFYLTKLNAAGMFADFNVTAARFLSTLRR